MAKKPTETGDGETPDTPPEARQDHRLGEYRREEVERVLSEHLELKPPQIAKILDSLDEVPAADD